MSAINLSNLNIAAAAPKAPKATTDDRGPDMRDPQSTFCTLYGQAVGHGPVDMVAVGNILPITNRQGSSARIVVITATDASKAGDPVVRAFYRPATGPEKAAYLTAMAAAHKATNSTD